MIKLCPTKKLYLTFDVIALVSVSAFIIHFFDINGFFFFILLVLSVLVVIWIRSNCLRFKSEESIRCQNLYRKRLLLLRRLIDHSYSYKYDAALFYKRFCEEVNIDKLRKNDLINRGEIISNLDFSTKRIGARKLEKLSNDDFEFLCMVNEGFTPRELSIIFGLSHPQSIYVKRHRIRLRFDKQAESDTKLTSIKSRKYHGVSDIQTNLSN